MYCKGRWPNLSLHSVFRRMEILIYQSTSQLLRTIQLDTFRETTSSYWSMQIKPFWHLEVKLFCKFFTQGRGEL